MPSLTLFQATPPEAFKSQILQLVIDNLGALGEIALPVDNPLFALYQYAIGHEMHQLLDAISGNAQLPVELIGALDDEDPSVLLGFLLYQPLTGVDDACSVACLVVRDGHRRQGLARALLEKMRARYPHADLACQPAQVELFEALGFGVLGVRGSQVLMNTRAQASEGLRGLVDVAAIYRSTEVRQIHAYLLKQHGEAAMREAEVQRDELLDGQAVQAAEVRRSRIRH